jgi:quinohemoprotein amine dehydrogenase alpha subunit-like protein
MSPEMSAIISIIFLVLGAAAVWTMMVRLGRQSTSRTLLIIHRVAGWLFTLVFAAMITVMTERMTRHWEPLSPLNTVHGTLAVTLLLLLALKLVIPRFFPGLAKHLFLIGFSTFLLGFTLVGISAGYYLVFKIRKIPYISHNDLSNTELDAQRGKQFLIVKCATCHIVKDILSNNNSPEGWERIVNRMVKLAAPQITPGEARQIIYFLASEYGPRSGDPIRRTVTPAR